MTYTVKDIRAMIDDLASAPLHVAVQAEAIARPLADRAAAIKAKASATGRDLLASEQRELERLTNSTAEELVPIWEREVRAQEAAVLRSAAERTYGSTHNAARSFGEQFRNAVDEVRDGKAQAFVDFPGVRNTLSESGTAGAGVPVEIKSPVSTLAAESIVMGLPGIRRDSMTSDRARYPRIGAATTGPTAEGEALTDANTVTDHVEVVAQKFSTYEELTSELVEDYSASALAVFGDNLLKRLALRVDLGFLEGDGAQDLLGIRQVSGTNSTSVAGKPTNFQKFRDAEYELLLDNGNPVVWVMHPRSWSTLAAIKTGIASDETTLLEPDPQQGPRTLLGHPVRFSTQITLVEGATSVGSWAALLDTSQLVVLERRPARLEVSREFKFDEDIVAVRATWRGGLAVLNPQAISLATDIRTA